MALNVTERENASPTGNLVYDSNTMSWVRMTQPVITAETVNVGGNVAVSGPLTNDELRAAPVSVTGTFDIASAVYSVRLAESGSVTYVGEAEIGSGETSSVWRVKKVDETSGVSITFAGDGSFGYRWDQRESLSYT